MKTGTQYRQDNAGIYAYVVVCCGIFHSIVETVRLRGDNRQANAERIARARQPGYVAYSVRSVEEE